ncbi:hypothetical protein, partial [Novosphingobium sp.]|uniref:hypothetical protein n=1 Tax=Novosphingobium sp. TaxID=1874826 RepID=UPI002FDA2BAE
PAESQAIVIALDDYESATEVNSGFENIQFHAAPLASIQSKPMEQKHKLRTFIALRPAPMSRLAPKHAVQRQPQPSRRDTYEVNDGVYFSQVLSYIPLCWLIPKAASRDLPN